MSDNIPTGGFELYAYLAQEIGLEARDKLYEVLAGRRIYIATKNTLLRPLRNAKIREDHANGKSVVSLMTEYGCSESTIQRALRTN